MMRSSWPRIPPAGLLVLLMAALALAQEAKLKKQTIVPIDTRPGHNGQVIDHAVLGPDGNPVIGPDGPVYEYVLGSDGKPRGPTADEVPVNFFPVPKPVPAGPEDKGKFRTIESLQEVLANRGELKPLVISKIDPKRPVGKSPGTKDGGIAEGDIFIVYVAAPALPGQSDDELRPDGTEKGRALIVGGDPREWMPTDAIMRRFQEYQDEKEYERRQKNLWDGTEAGDEAAFFAENVKTFFVPFVSPSAIKLTQDDYNLCYFLEKALPGSETDMGSLRHGRVRRKNLNDVLTATVSNAAKDHHGAVLGVNIDRQTSDDAFLVKKGDPRFVAYDRKASAEYRGKKSKLEPETDAMTKAGNTAFKVGALGYLTGSAFLTVNHTHADNGVRWPVGGMEDTQKLGAVQKAYALAITSLSEATSAKSDGDTLGTIDRFMRFDLGVPSARLELPPDSRATLSVSGPGYQPFPGGTVYTAPTLESLVPIVGEGDEHEKKQLETKHAIDAALHWAAGPPYVRQVLLLQKKEGSTAGDGKYDRSKLGADAEVIYDKSWVIDPGDSTGARRMTEDGAHVPEGGSRWANAKTEVTLVVMFSKPMRASSNTGLPLATLEVVKNDAKSTPIDIGIPHPAIAGGKSKWQTGLAKGLKAGDPIVGPLGVKRYDFDTWIVTFTLKPRATIRTSATHAKFRIQDADRVGLVVDANPKTVAGWRSFPSLSDGDWTGYERGGERGFGTDADETHSGFDIDTENPRFVKLPE